MRQPLLQQKTMGLVQSPRNCLPQYRNLAAPPFARQLGQGLWVGLPAHHGAQHGPAGNPHHVRHDAAQLDVGILQHFSNASADPHLFLLERGPAARPIPQRLEGLRRHEAALPQAMLQEVRDPLAVFQVGFSSSQSPHLYRVG